MNNFKLSLFTAVIVVIISSCSIFKYSAPVYEIDPVCQMKVDKSEAYTYKYNGKEYYFDKVNCKEVFKMDPENILKKNSCEPIK